MLTQRDKVLLSFLILGNLFFWGLFGTVFFRFHEAYTRSTVEYAALSAQELELLLQNIAQYNTLDNIVMAAWLISALLNTCGIYFLHTRPLLPSDPQELPIERKLNSFHGGAAALLLILFWFFFLRSPGPVYLWIEMIPFMLLSIDFVLLAFAVLRHSQKYQHGSP